MTSHADTAAQITDQMTKQIKQKEREAMTIQADTASQITEQMSKQMKQMASLTNMFGAQSEKAIDFWMNQTVDAIKESQKLTKEWMLSGKTLADEWFSAVQTNAKEMTKIFTPTA